MSASPDVRITAPVSLMSRLDSTRLSSYRTSPLSRLYGGLVMAINKTRGAGRLVLRNLEVRNQPSLEGMLEQSFGVRMIEGGK